MDVSPGTHPVSHKERRLAKQHALLFIRDQVYRSGARMILTCPACGTSYTVKDGAIPPRGRTVRCAACKHSWHQAGEVVASETAEAVAEPEPVEVQPLDAPVESESSDPNAEPAHEPMASDAGDAAIAPEPEEPVIAEEPVAAEPDSELSDWNEADYGGEEPARRGKGLRIVLILVLLVVLLAAGAWFLAPREWMARAGLATGAADSPLKLMVTSQDRQKLASGNDLVSLSGRVINPTDATQPVPALQADLRDGGGKLVYSWTIAPPAPRLAPRASASFNAAELGVPANATSLTLRWAS
ncbi:MAG: zinc-ribbon domain-containing protein [Sphingomicrobium sp.]